MPSPPSSSRPVALVTGAGSGIGLASARSLAAQGFDLVIVGRRLQPLQDAAAMIRRETPDAETHAIAADIGDPDASAGIIRETIDRFGRLDALINNAGAAPLKPIHEHTPAVLREAFAVNALGPGALIAAAWPHLVARNAGVIVNLSTMGTADPFPGFFAYAAAKAAVNSYARSIATEGAAHNIKGFAIAPGAVETPMLRSLFDETALPRDRTLSPDAIAKIVVECVTGKRDPQNGTTIFVPSPG